MKLTKGAATDVDLDGAALAELVGQYQEVYRAETGDPFPQEPRAQLDLAIEAVFKSWNTPRAIAYRRKEHIDDGMGTAVNVQQMVFGNTGARSGTGVAFTRNPSTGEPHPYGEYLQMRRARMSSPAPARGCRWRSSAGSNRRPTPSWSR